MTDFKPGNYELIELKLINFKGDELDIQGLFSQLDIYEDIFSSTVSAELSMVDAVDLFKSFPLLTQEKLSVKFRTDDGFNIIQMFLYCYSITPPVEISYNGAKTYVMSFVSKEKMIDQSSFMSRSMNQPNCAAVRSILLEELQTTKKIFLDPCSSTFTYQPMQHRPFETIMLAVARSKSRETLTPSYVFFESNRGFNFFNLEKRVQSEPRFTYEFIGQKSVEQTTENQFYSIISHVEVKPPSGLELQTSGVTGSTVAAFDPMTRTVKQSTKSYFNDDQYKENSKMQNGSATGRVLTNEYEFKNPSTYNLVVAGSKGDLIQERKYLLNQYTNMLNFHIKVPGNSELAVGDMISIEIPFSVTESDELTNTNLSGKYLITALRHKLRAQEYFCSMEISKDSFSDDISKNADKLKVVKDV